MVYDTPHLQNEFGDPRIFYVSNIILSFSTSSQSCKKICTWEIFGANVLKFASDQEPATPIIRQCNGIFTDQFIFRYFFSEIGQFQFT